MLTSTTAAGLVTSPVIVHGHVRATGGLLGENIAYWRLPESEGGQVIVDNSWGTMNGNDLRDHLTDF